MNQSCSADIFFKKTRAAFVWNRILRAPVWAIYCMLPFILFKDLHATPTQIAIAIGIKPLVSIFSLYWSSVIEKRTDRLVSNIAWAQFIGVFPFFFFPFFNSPWFFIFALGLYMMMHRGVIPAWMEIMKRNISGSSREKIFAVGSAFGYLGDGVFPFFIGWMMDGYDQAWRWIFPATALLSFSSMLFLIRFPIRSSEEETPAEPTPLRERWSRPWSNSWKLLQRRPDFRKFQIGFMLGGTGLMLMHAVLPAFFMGSLKLSYTELAIALTLCKGVGFVLTNQMWAKWMTRVDLFRFSSWVTVLAFLFPVSLLVAEHHINWVYFAYFIYGMMQAGSELSWNMSGPIFANEEESSVYSGVNVLAVGLRGCFAPLIGSLMGNVFGPKAVLLAGGIFCLLATYRMASYSTAMRKSQDALAG